MSVRPDREKIIKLFKKIRPFILLLLVVAGVLSGITFAKYYSLQKQKGVALASDFYFTSDILKNDLVLTDGAPTKISPYVASNIWNAGGSLSTMTFQVRNYANSLLYNDENIMLEYEVYVMLTEADSSGISYYLNYGNGQSVEISTTPVKITDTLSGGSPLSNEYALQYRYTSGIKNLPKDVYIWIVPTAPSYIPSSEYAMGSRVSVRETAAKFSVTDGWGFLKLESAGEVLTAAQKKKINAQAGFVYNISTSGSNAEADDKNKVNLILTWDSNYIELDRFSEFYDSDRITVGADGRKSLPITINTYTSNDILFYRTSAFSVDDFSTQGEFAALAEAVLSTEAP